MKNYINREMVAALFILMLNYENAGSRENKLKKMVNLEMVPEPAMQVENWMTDEQVWNREPKADYLLIEEENKQMIEEWMIRENFPGFNKEVIKEQELRIEDWMIEPGKWIDN